MALHEPSARAGEETWQSLPFVDEHRVVVRASQRDTWDTLVRYVGRTMAPSVAVAAVLGAKPSRYSDGDVGPGSTVPGFRVACWDPPHRLVLEGSHRFSVYALLLRLVAEGDGTTLCASTRAAFPGVTGTLYRHAVISSGFHAASVRSVLDHVRRKALDTDRTTGHRPP